MIAVILTLMVLLFLLSAGGLVVLAWAVAHAVEDDE